MSHIGKHVSLFLSRLLQDQDPQKALDPFDENSDAKLTAIARKFEEKYVSLHLHHLRAKTCDLLRMRKRVDLTFDPGDFIAIGPQEKEKKNPPIGTKSASAEFICTAPILTILTCAEHYLYIFSKPIGLDR